MSHASDIVPAPGGSLVEATISPPRYLNPLLCAYGTTDEDVVRLCFAGLTRRDPAGFVVPDLAERWDVGPDLLSYTFTLRPGLRFHDGQPLRVADVVATIGLLQSKGFRGDPGLVDRWRDVRVQVPADGQIRLLLPEPDATFPETCSLGIVPERWVHEVTGQDPRDSAFNATPIGAGPFRVATANRSRVQLSVADTYQGPRPFLRGVEFRVLADDRAVESALLAGEAGAARLARPLDASASGGAPRVIGRPIAGRLTALILNTRSAPLTEQLVRRCIALALDRAAIASAALGGNAGPADGPICPTSWAYGAGVARPRLDIAQARALLDSAGWTNESGARRKEGRALEIAVTASSAEHIRAAESVAEQLARIGFTARVNRVSSTEYVERVLGRRDFAAAIVTQTTTTTDPALYGLYHSSQIETELNVGGWVSQRADPLLDTARREQSVVARARAYLAFEAVFAEECPAVPLYRPIMRYAIWDGLRGVDVAHVTSPADRLAGLAGWHRVARRAPALV